MLYRFIFLFITFAHIPVFADQAQTPDFFAIETEVYKENYSDRYKIWSGSFNEDGTQAYLEFVKSIYDSNKKTNPELFFETQGYHLIEKERTPQDVKKFNIKSTFKRTCNFLKNCVIDTPKAIKTNFKQWVRIPENKLRLTFTLIAATVDGTVNAMVLVLFNGVGIEHGIIMGTTIATLSGTWSFFTPQLAKFFNNNPSIVDRFFKFKYGLKYQAGKWFEGLLKWGLVQATFVSSSSGVSLLLGIIPPTTFLAWTKLILYNAAITTAGQGVLDYSLSVEIDRSVKNAKTIAEVNRVLKSSYVVGTIAASISALGSIASIFNLDFGNYLLYGLLGAGTINFARLYKDQILQFYNHSILGCSKYLKMNQKSYEYWGSE